MRFCVAFLTLSISFSDPLTSTRDECSFGRVENITCTLKRSSISFTYGVSLSGTGNSDAIIGSSKEISKGVDAFRAENYNK